MKKIQLRNTGDVDAGFNLYFPRLQSNSRGEIVLAMSKEGSLTTGLLVGFENKTAEGNCPVPIGHKFTDWEVFGKLTDYNGKVSIQFENKVMK